MGRSKELILRRATMWSLWMGRMDASSGKVVFVVWFRGWEGVGGG